MSEEVVHIHKRSAEEFLEAVNVELNKGARRIIHVEIYETNNHYSAWIEVTL